MVDEVLVVGAGAAGLWVAARAAELGLDVRLLEKTARAGTKILASGGTHCNLTTTFDAQRAGQTFGTAGARFLKRSFATLPPEAVRERFEALGVPTVEAPLDKIFPKSGRARDVRDALLHWAEAQGVRIEYGRGVRELERTEEGLALELEGGERIEATTVVLSLGGQSYPLTGTTGDGYGWLEALGLSVVPPVPALVPLASQASWVHGLSGIALQEVAATLVDRGERRLGRSTRPLLFTHQGLSGPCAMDLSEQVARGLAEDPKSTFTLVVDTLPGLSREELRSLLIEAAGKPGQLGLARALEARLPRRLVDAIAQVGGYGGERSLPHKLSKSDRHALVETFKGVRIPVRGTLGFDKAEVTAGGLALREVDPGSLRVRKVPGLYACGELLDLAGPIGGLNFQAAFVTAELCALDLAKRRGSAT